jgi:hypothetical protein
MSFKLGWKPKIAMSCFSVVLGICLSSMLAFSQAEELPSLKPNQTFGFGDNELLRFTYKQSFDCVDQPHDDLNFNGILAQSDPEEFQIPICQVGIQPTIDPTGLHGANDPTEPLYVLVPMFSVDNDQNPNDAISCNHVVPGTTCGAALGKTLITLFGALPEAFKARPLVYTQCPDPTLPPGTCTMHASRVDLGPVLVKLGYLPSPPANVFVPTPNHSHIVLNQDVKIRAIWWQVIPVLVLDRGDWPPADGSSGITSFSKMKEAEEDGKAIQAPSNFYLFFSSQAADHDHSH